MRGLVFAFLAALLAGVPAHGVTVFDGNVQCIWDNAYSAFPSIIKYGRCYYVTFREGESHIFDSKGEAAGKIRILRSRGGRKWKSVALLEKEGYDLRDPKLSVTPDGKLMVTIGGSVYRKRKLVSRQPQVSFSRDGRHFSEPAATVLPSPKPGSKESSGAWIWRVTWDKASSCGYTIAYWGKESGYVTLMRTSDGINYERVTDIEAQGFPNEATLRFLPDGRMLMFLRRDAGDKMACWGVSRPPYTDWDVKPLDFQVGGPDFIILENGTVVAGGRDYTDGIHRTYLWKGTPDGNFTPWRVLPSGGDNSYPGFMVVKDEIWVVYYSSHELKWPDGRSRAGIYLARIPIESI